MAYVLWSSQGMVKRCRRNPNWYGVTVWVKLNYGVWGKNLQKNLPVLERLPNCLKNHLLPEKTKTRKLTKPTVNENTWFTHQHIAEEFGREQSANYTKSRWWDCGRRGKIFYYFSAIKTLGFYFHLLAAAAILISRYVTSQNLLPGKLRDAYGMK